jgi:uncharacterized protein
LIKEQDNFEGLNITLHTTEDCLLRCKYCYQHQKKPGNLPFEYATKFIDLILTDPDPINVIGTDNEWILKKGLIIDFIGGDSLIQPDFLDDILKYYIFKSVSLNHKWSRNWRSSISTSGTLFSNSKVRDFMMKYKENLSVGCSIDGCPEIHDANRIFKNGKGTISEIMKWWDWYLGWACDSASTKATCNKDSIPYLEKSIKFLHEEMSLKYININFVFEDLKLTDYDLKQLDEQFGLCVEYILKHRHDIFVGFFRKSWTEVTEPDPDSGWCGSGSMPCLSINGKIYPCFRFAPVTMYKPELDFPVGDIWNGFNHKERFEIVRSQTRSKITPDKCKGCSIDGACSWCIGGAYSEEGKFYRQTNICEIHKLQAKWAKIYWDKYKELENNEK